MKGIGWFRLRNSKIGLALGGGAAWSIAQIGFLEVLYEHGISIDGIAGTSAGSMVASLYAFGMPLHEIKENALKLTLSDVFHWRISKMGLSQTDRIKEYIKRMIGEKRIDESNIPLYITATNLLKAEPYVFPGDCFVHDAVAASCAIPGIFVPEEVDGDVLVDGSLLADVNCKALKENGFDVVIGVEVCNCSNKKKPANLFEVILESFQSMVERSNIEMRKFADLMLRIDVADIGRFEVDKSPVLLEKGREAAFRVIDELKNLI